MSADVWIPHDPAAERAVVGSMLGWSDCLDLACRSVTAEDFYTPLLAEVFAASYALWLRGDAVDPVTVCDELRTRRDGQRDVEEERAVTLLVSELVVPGRLKTYCRIVREHAARRKLQQTGYSMVSDTPSDDPAEMAGRSTKAIEAIVRDLGSVQMAVTLDEILDAPPETWEPWVIPGLCRTDWRILVCARAGIGKTMLLHQLAGCAAQGVEPFTGRPGHRPQRVLIVDAENSRERLRMGRPIVDYLRRVVGDSYDEHLVRFWRTPDGFDLRNGRSQAALENVIAAHRPALVVAGPMYQLCRPVKGDNWEDSAAAHQQVWDRYRLRYGFGLVLEDQAPRGAEIRPYGSTMWDYWPEVGPALKVPDGVRKQPPSELDVGHWRPSRILAHGWPDKLQRGSPGELPWAGWWRDGMPEPPEGMF